MARRFVADLLEKQQRQACEEERFTLAAGLGDGTGAGKGRQVAGIILDNWCKGRRRAVWISVSDRLLEDAQRDWAALAPADGNWLFFVVVDPDTGETRFAATAEEHAANVEIFRQWLRENPEG